MSNFVSSLLRRAALAAGIALTSSSAFATQITYEFTTINGNYGSFSYEDTQAPDYPDTLAAGYKLLSFTLDGVSLPKPTVGLFNNSPYYWADVAIIGATNSDGVRVSLWLFSRTDSALFNSTDLAQLNGRTLADFTDPGFRRTRLDIGSEHITLTSLQQVASIPEPGTSALMALGLAALAVRSRMKKVTMP